jgi:hypothetical protein
MVDAGVVDAVVAQTCTAEAFTRLVEAAASGAGYVLVATEYSRIVAFLDFRFGLTVPSCAACTARRGRPALAWDRG